LPCAHTGLQAGFSLSLKKTNSNTITAQQQDPAIIAAQSNDQTSFLFIVLCTIVFHTNLND